MIKRIRSKLAVKVFLLTAVLMSACCSITYLCIVRFAPYIYSHDLSEVEEMAYAYSEELMIEMEYIYSEGVSNHPLEEMQYTISVFSEDLKRYSDDEFEIHLFNDNGKEVSLPYDSTLTGKQISDYKDADRTAGYKVTSGIEEYTLFIAKNTNKESQIVDALQKAVPILCIIIAIMSVVIALFYTLYITAPITKVSKLSKQMANMDFSGFCPAGRTDEIGMLSNSLNTLSKKLSTTLSELQEANQKLQADIDIERQLEQQRTDFFSAAAHELKTPITIIKGQLQGMLYQVGRYKDRETYLAESLEVTDTLEKIVQELLTISRLDTPGYTCNKHNIDLSKLINERLAAYEDLFMQKDLIVEKSILPETYIVGDMQLLQKVLDNLLANAAAYSEAGNHIFVKLWNKTGRINLTIENTGVHIPNEYIPKLFEAFYRVEQSRNRQTGGTGLGLYIVKTIIDLHKAEIKIANTIQGVIVSVQF